MIKGDGMEMMTHDHFDVKFGALVAVQNIRINAQM
jgi:hypothetical protein